MAKMVNDDREHPIFETTSFNDIINSLDKVIGIKISFIPGKNIFLYSDMNKNTHMNILLQLALSGYFPGCKTYTEVMNTVKPINFGITNKKEGIQEFYNDSYTQAIKYNNGLFAITLRPDHDPYKNTAFNQIMSKYKQDDKVDEQINEVLRIAGITNPFSQQ